MNSRTAKSIGLKLLALVFATMLWIIVVNVDDPIDIQRFGGISVKVTHDEIVTNKGKVYQIVGESKTVNVEVRAKRSVLAKIKTEDIVATADMREIELSSMIPITISIKGYDGKFESAIATPRNLEVSVEPSASNKFPITATAIGTLQDGYMLGELTTNPETVTIGGPDSLINTISRVVAKVDVSGVSEDQELPAELVLYDGNDNVIDQTLIENNIGKQGLTVNVHLLNTKSVPLELDTSNVIPREGYAISGVSYEPQEILVAGKAEVLGKLEKIALPGSALILEDLTKKTEQVVDLLSYLPEGVSLVDSNANGVAITISVQKAGTKVVDVPVLSIVVNNAPTDLKLSYATTEDVELTFNGAREVLDNLVIDKKVFIDLKTYKEPGSYAVPIQVELPNGCTMTQQVTALITLEKK
ncbi:MAG: CdaR family protein [Lachnospiraceae bacterium]